MSQKGSFWNWYKMIGIIKALKCCQNLYQVIVCPCPGAFFKWWPWVDLDHFYDRVKFVSWCFCMGAGLYSIECSCISKFVLIQHILSTQVSDTRPMVLWFSWPYSMARLCRPSILIFKHLRSCQADWSNYVWNSLWHWILVYTNGFSCSTTFLQMIFLLFSLPVRKYR